MALSATAVLNAQLVVAQQQKLSTVEKLNDGIVVRVGDSFLKIEVCTDTRLVLRNWTDHQRWITPDTP
jgi:hypothetical protein